MSHKCIVLSRSKNGFGNLIGCLKTFSTFLLFDVGINTPNIRGVTSSLMLVQNSKFPREVLKIHFWKRMSVFIFPVYETCTNHSASGRVYRREKHPQNKLLLAVRTDNPWLSPCRGTSFPCLIETPIKGLLWNIHSYNQSLVQIPSCLMC